MKGLKCFLLVLCGVSMLVTVATILYHKMYRGMLLSFLRPDGEDIFTPDDWDKDTVDKSTIYSEANKPMDM